MTIINNYKVTSNHKTGLYPASCRVKTLDGVIVAHITAKRGDVLSFVRKNPLSTECAQLKAQLVSNGVSEEDITAILSVAKEESHG